MVDSDPSLRPSETDIPKAETPYLRQHRPEFVFYLDGIAQQAETPINNLHLNMPKHLIIYLKLLQA